METSVFHGRRRTTLSLQREPIQEDLEYTKVYFEILIRIVGADQLAIMKRLLIEETRRHRQRLEHALPRRTTVLLVGRRLPWPQYLGTAPENDLESTVYI